MIMRRLVMVTVGLLLFVCADEMPAHAEPSPAWVPAGTMTRPHSWTKSALLADGRFIVPGSGVVGANGMAQTDNELYDPKSNLWALGKPLTSARAFHSVTRLDSGLILVAGGIGADGMTINTTAELYDPVADTWSETTMAIGRGWHTATLLADGTVLVAGGCALAPVGTAERYDPMANTWQQDAPMITARCRHTATLLADGRVFIIGGTLTHEGASPQSSAEIYDPAKPMMERWTAVPVPALPLPTFPRDVGTATLLDNGKVLVAGGGSSGAALSNALLYDPSLNEWTDAGDMLVPRINHTAVKLADGSVLAIGGANNFQTERYDPTTNVWSFAGEISVIRGSPTAALLQDGTVILAGGAYEVVAERYLLTDGSACIDESVCQSGICFDGACCSGPECGEPTTDKPRSTSFYACATAPIGSRRDSYFVCALFFVGLGARVHVSRRRSRRVRTHGTP